LKVFNHKHQPAKQNITGETVQDLNLIK